VPPQLQKLRAVQVAGVGDAHAVAAYGEVDLFDMPEKTAAVRLQ